MGLDMIKDFIEKLPVGILMVFYSLYIGYSYYSFQHSSSSEYVQKLQRLMSAQEVNKKSKIKLNEIHEFIKNLNDKKTEIRIFSKDLEDLKGFLSEYLDVPKFMKIIISEAKRVGMIVLSLSPSGSAVREYYSEQTFILEFKGAFIQYLAFLQKLATASDIFRVENFELKTIGAAHDRFVELQGKVEIKTYRYVRSKADNVGK